MHEEGKIVAEQRIIGHERAKPQTRFAQSQKHSHKNWFWQLSIGLLFTCLIAYGWSMLFNPQYFPIHSVQVKGNYPHVNHELLRKTILPYTQKGFFGADTTSLQDRILQLPWVASAKVRKIWPNSLVIVLSEQVPIAHFDDKHLVNNKGELFNIGEAKISSDLPKFNGSLGQQKIMSEMYQQILPLVTPLKLQISSLTLDPRQSWQLQLNNGLIILVGRTEPFPRLQRFFAIYPRVILPKLAMIRAVDLRYAHGIAVSFKEIERGEPTWQKNLLEI